MPKNRKSKVRYYRDGNRFRWAFILPNGIELAGCPADGEGYNTLYKCQARFNALVKAISARDYVVIRDLDAATPERQAVNA